MGADAGPFHFRVCGGGWRLSSLSRRQRSVAGSPLGLATGNKTATLTEWDDSGLAVDAAGRWYRDGVLIENMVEAV